MGVTRRRAAGEAHRSYLSLQRRLSHRISQQISDETGRLPAHIQAYYLEYLRDVEAYEKVVPRSALLRAVASAGIVLGGDYHSFDQAKKVHLRILRRVRKRRPRIVLALECFRAEHQELLDDWTVGRIDEAELLSETRWRESWGFDWHPYRELLLWAASHDLELLAMDQPLGPQRRTLAGRDRFMAEVLAGRLEEGRDKPLIYAVVGDWHLARSHLPAAVQARTRSWPLLIYQNCEAIYWKLASEGLEQATDVVRLRRGAYCVVNATPFVKLASYALWSGRREEATALAERGALASASPSLPFTEREGWARETADLTDAISFMVDSIARFLDVEVTVDFTLFTPEDDLLIHRLIKELGSAGPDFFHHVAIAMYYGRTFYLPPLRAIYVGRALANQLADAAAIYVHHQLSGDQRLARVGCRGFYVRVLRETATFVGAKVINHKRPYMRRADYERIRQEAQGRRLRGLPREKSLIAKYYLQHRAMEKRMRRGGRPTPATARVYRLPPVVRWGVTRGLGQALGHKLYETLVHARLEKAEIADLFRIPFSDHRDPRALYLRLVERTRRVRTSVPSRDERL